MIGADVTQQEPRTRTVIDDPVIVEFTDPDGVVTTPRWIGGNCTIEYPLNDLPTCMLPIALESGGLINVGTQNVRKLMPLDLAVHDDVLVTIRLAREERPDVVLFEGYADQLRRSGGPEGHAASLQLTHIAAMISEPLRGKVWGQLRRDSGSREGQYDNPHPTLYDGHGMMAVFNPDGTKNCQRSMMQVRGMRDADGEPDGTFVPVFTHGYDSDRQAWTYARVLMYLLYWARRVPGEPFGRPDSRDDGLPTWQDHAAPRRWQVGVGHTLRNIVDLNLAAKIKELRLDDFDPDALGPSAGASDPWAAALSGKPNSLAIHGMAWLDALTLVCSKAGLHFHWRHTFNKEGEPQWGIEFSVAGAARVTEVNLASPEFYVEQHTEAEIAAANNVARFSVAGDTRGAHNQVKVLGAAPLYEVTVELLPGWQQNDDWDVPLNPGDAGYDDAVRERIARIGNEEWLQRYNNNASLAAGIDYFHVGRRWGLNTFGAWKQYGRTTQNGTPLAQWGADDYERTTDWTFPDSISMGARHGLGELRIGNTAPPQDDQVWAREKAAARPRQIEAMVSAQGPEHPYPPRVEISHDSGQTWKLATADIEIMRTDFRVRIGAADLRDPGLASSDGAMSYPEAYIRGKLRVRITCGVRGDFATDLAMAESGESLSRRKRCALLVWADDARILVRDGTPEFSGGNSQLRTAVRTAAGLPTIGSREENTTGAAQARMYDLLRNTLDRVSHRGTIDLMGLVFYRKVEQVSDRGESTTVEYGYKPGDMLRKIAAEPTGDRYSIPLAARKDGASYAIITRVTHNFSLGRASDGAGANLTTTLQLESNAFGVRAEGQR